MKRAIALSLLALGVHSSATARPVPIGRYVEIAYGVSSAHPYPTGLANARRTGRTSFAGPERLPSLLWESRLTAGRIGTPAVQRDGTLYLPTALGITAVRPSGEVLFNLPVGYTHDTPSIAPTGDIVFGTHAGLLFLASPAGEILARGSVSSAVRGSALVLADGSIVVSAAEEQSVHRFDSDLSRVFRAPLGIRVSSQPAWSNRGEIWVAATDRVDVLSARGDLVRRTTLDSNVIAGPAIASDGTAWVLGEDAVLRQLSDRGVVRTETPLNVPAGQAQTFSVGEDGSVRVPTRANALVCIGPGGVERWRVDSEGSFPGGVVLDSADRAYTVNDAGVLLAIDRDGRVLWRAQTGTRIADASHPVIGPDGTIYFATLRASLQAWK
jgi:hypothetical protein